MNTILLLCFALISAVFISFIMYMFLNEERRKGNKKLKSSMISIAIVSTFAFTPVLTICIFLPLNYFVFGDKLKSVENEIKTKKGVASSAYLLKTSKTWLNSFEDKKFSNYELYLLRDVQETTKVKVYDTALIISNNASVNRDKVFRELLFKSARLLNQTK